MNHPEAHTAVLHGAVNVNQVASVTGRDAARIHLILHPGEVIQALCDGRWPAFHWSTTPVCGVSSTRGWIDTDSGSRQVCRL